MRPAPCAWVTGEARAGYNVQMRALSPDDPPAFSTVNADRDSRVVLTCDHAGRAVPRAWGDLGVPAAEFDRHIAWDIGAGDVTRHLARLLDAPAVLATYSRLFIDPNRPPGSDGSIVAASDGTPVPANVAIDEAERQLRARISFWPYHRAIERLITRNEAFQGVVALVSVHSFTPRMRGFDRPWHVGVLWDGDDRIAGPLIAALGRDAGLLVGDNEPYTATSPAGYALDAYGLGPGRPHVMVEIRQDLIATEAGVAEWAGRLHRALGPILADPALYRLRRPLVRTGDPPLS
jgi:predicted N-formylglutamate amidohydrolase